MAISPFPPLPSTYVSPLFIDSNFNRYNPLVRLLKFWPREILGGSRELVCIRQSFPLENRLGLASNQVYPEGEAWISNLFVQSMAWRKSLSTFSMSKSCSGMAHGEYAQLHVPDGVFGPEVSGLAKAKRWGRRAKVCWHPSNVYCPVDLASQKKPSV